MNKQVVVVAGICGCGKSTLAQALADALSCEFIEADDFHSEASRQKMTQGIPLTDEDRFPWLDKLNALTRSNAPCVISCSALKSTYRERLLDGADAKIVWLAISRELAEQRVSSRENHFMPSHLVESQLLIAEPPEQGLIVQADTPLSQLVEQALNYIKTT